MRKYLTLMILWASILSVFGQSVEKLEKKLSTIRSSEELRDKMGIAQKLLQLDPLNYKAIHHICRYYENRKIDSISIFFDNLIAKYPNKAQPLILRLQFLYFEQPDRKEYYKLKFKYLNSALLLDRSNKSTIFLLAESYYKDFIIPRDKSRDDVFTYDGVVDTAFINSTREIKKSTYSHSADSALKYFYKLWDIDTGRRDIIYFPIRQLEHYLNKKGTSPISENIMQNNEYCYFPPWYFANINKNWECNDSIDYLFILDLSQHDSYGISKHLSALKETCLYNQTVDKDFESYRFTWLRSFHNPICIRIEKTNNGIFLYWKVGKGMGGYEPKGLKASGKKKITENEWNEFRNHINKSNFDNLPNEKYVLMTDGASWILERKTKNNFKAHKTNEPSNEFKNCCLYLLKLSKIKVKEENIY